MSTCYRLLLTNIPTHLSCEAFYTYLRAYTEEDPGVYNALLLVRHAREQRPPHPQAAGKPAEAPTLASTSSPRTATKKRGRADEEDEERTLSTPSRNMGAALVDCRSREDARRLFPHDAPPATSPPHAPHERAADQPFASSFQIGTHTIAVAPQGVVEAVPGTLAAARARDALQWREEGLRAYAQQRRGGGGGGDGGESRTLPPPALATSTATTTTSTAAGGEGNDKDKSTEAEEAEEVTLRLRTRQRWPPATPSPGLSLYEVLYHELSHALAQQEAGPLLGLELLSLREVQVRLRRAAAAALVGAARPLRTFCHAYDEQQNKTGEEVRWEVLPAPRPPLDVSAVVLPLSTQQRSEGACPRPSAQESNFVQVGWSAALRALSQVAAQEEERKNEVHHAMSDSGVYMDSFGNLLFLPPSRDLVGQRDARSVSSSGSTE